MYACVCLPISILIEPFRYIYHKSWRRRVYLIQVLHLFLWYFTLFVTGGPSIDGSPVINRVKCQINRWGTCNRYIWRLQDCSRTSPMTMWTLYTFVRFPGVHISKVLLHLFAIVEPMIFLDTPYKSTDYTASFMTSMVHYSVDHSCSLVQLHKDDRLDIC